MLKRDAIVAVSGVEIRLIDALEKRGVSYRTFRKRIEAGWSLERAIIAPPDHLVRNRYPLPISIAPRQKRAVEKSAGEKFVYVIVQSGHADICKIGIAKSPQKRRGGIQNGNPYKVTIFKTYGPFKDEIAQEIERRTHRDLVGHRMSGEWFLLPPAKVHRAVERMIESVCRRYEIPRQQTGISV